MKGENNITAYINKSDIFNYLSISQKDALE